MGDIAQGPCADLCDCLSLATRDEAMRRTLAVNADRFGAFSGCPELEVYWRVMRSWIANYGHAGDVPADHYADECAAASEREHGSSAGVGDYARWLCTRDVHGLSRRFLTDRLRALCVMRCEAAWREAAVSGADAAEVKASLAELDVARAIGEVPSEVNPFRNGLAGIDAHMVEQRRRPMGVSFLDVAAGGGLIGGEMALFIMPSGAGKTTLALQMVRACVERGRHVVYVQMEQPLQGDIMRRLLVLATGATRDEWAVGSLAESSAELKERLEASVDKWSKYFHFVDHWQSPAAPFRSVQALDDMLAQYRQGGIEPFLLLLDWWGIARLKIMASCRLTDGQARRDHASAELGLLASVADKHNVVVGVFHQMAGAEAGKGRPGSVFGGQEDKNLVQFFDMGVTSDRPDKSDGTISFLVDKARMGAGGTVRQKLDGQRCMFVEPPEDAYRVSVAQAPAAAEQDAGQADGQAPVMI